MSTCAQNQSNQEEEGSNNEPGETAPQPPAVPPGGGHEAVQHFLANQQAANGGVSRSNGLPPQAARGIQVRKVALIFFSEIAREVTVRPWWGLTLMNWHPNLKYAK